MKTYKYRVGDVDYLVEENHKYKVCRATDGSYAYLFNKVTGEFIRPDIDGVDPDYCPCGPFELHKIRPSPVTAAGSVF